VPAQSSSRYGKAAIVGTALTVPSREASIRSTPLALEAVEAAITDAGLAIADVDGLASYPVRVPEDTHWMADALGLRELGWYADIGAWGPASMSSIGAAIAAVEAGACKVAVAYRAVTLSERVPAGQAEPGRVLTEQQELYRPYAFSKAPQWMAMWARHHFDTNGTGPDDLGTIAIETRKHAIRNPSAIARAPLTMNDYLASPVISEPLRLFDCDFPVNGAGAVVITRAERARDLPSNAAVVASWAISTGPSPSWTQWPDLSTMAANYACDRMWERADGLRPRDLDCIQVYDGFSVVVLYWLEALGLCPPGDGARYLREHGMGRDAPIPINTFGGSLSHGRLHGITHVIEAVRQIQGTAGPTQLPSIETAAVGVGAGPLAGALLLTSDR